MEKVQLGNTGVSVSKLIYGSLTLGPLQKNYSVALGSTCILYAHERGVTTFDTAQYYKTYPYLREVVKKDPGVMICSKSYAYDEVGARNAVEEAMREIGRDYIDVFLMHEQESEHTIRGHRAALDMYLKMKQDKFIGHVGLSTHCVAGVYGALKYPEIEVIHPMINKVGMGIVDGTREDMEQALKLAHQKGIGLYGMKVLAGGNLLSDRESALDYALEQEYLDAIALGMASEKEIDYNISYFAGEKEKAKSIGAEINDKSLFIEQWCSGCGACTRRCQQRALRVVDGKCAVDSTKCVLCGYCAPSCPEFAIKVI